MMKYKLMILCASPLALAGCASMQEWLGKPGVSENLGALGKGALEVATNPLDFFAWYEIALAVTGLIVGPPAAVKVKRVVEQVVKDKIINPAPEAPPIDPATYGGEPEATE